MSRIKIRMCADFLHKKWFHVSLTKSLVGFWCQVCTRVDSNYQTKDTIIPYVAEYSKCPCSTFT